MPEGVCKLAVELTELGLRTRVAHLFTADRALESNGGTALKSVTEFCIKMQLDV